MMMRALVLLPTILYGFAQAALLRYTFDLAEGPWAPDGKYCLPLSMLKF